MKTVIVMRPTLEEGVPIPPRYTHSTKWKDFLLNMKPGQSFIARDAKERQSVYRCAEHAGVPITTRQINGCGYRIWRTA